MNSTVDTSSHELQGKVLISSQTYYSEDGLKLLRAGFGKSFVLKKGTKIICDRAFMGNMLENIVLNDELEYIGNEAFQECYDLKKISFPSNLKYIGDFAFKWCLNVKDFAIPATVYHIGKNPFQNFKQSPEISIGFGSKYFDVCHGMLMDVQRKRIISNCNGSKNPSICMGTEIIEDYAFRASKSLTKIILPSSISTIGEEAFWRCDSLKEITLSENLEVVKSAAFMKCEKLQSLYFPDSTKYIGEGAFYKCLKLNEVRFGTGIEYLGKNILQTCNSLEKILFPRDKDQLFKTIFSRYSNRREEDRIYSKITFY